MGGVRGEPKTPATQSTENSPMHAPKQAPNSPGTDLDELARTESMITRCEARITAQLQLLATLSPWESKSQTVREEVNVEEDVLQGLQDQKAQLPSGLKESATIALIYPTGWNEPESGPSRISRSRQHKALMLQPVPSHSRLLRCGPDAHGHASVVHGAKLPQQFGGALRQLLRYTLPPLHRALRLDSLLQREQPALKFVALRTQLAPLVVHGRIQSSPSARCTQASLPQAPGQCTTPMGL